MTTDYITAVDEMYGMVLDFVNENYSVIGYLPEIKYANLKSNDIPDNSKFWLRVSHKTITSKQITFKTTARRFEVKGLLLIQIYAPVMWASSAEKARLFSDMLKNIFRGHSESDNIWFRDSKVEELPPDESFYRFNVIVSYSYDEIQ